MTVSLRFYIYVFIAAFLMQVSHAYAQQALNVTTSGKGDYSRLVLDADGGLDYKLEESKDGVLSLSIDRKDLNYNSSAINKDSLNIGSITQSSKQGENLDLKITIPETSRFRHFKVGSRIIIDIYDPADGQRNFQTVENKQAPAPVKEEPKKAKAEVKPGDVPMTLAERIANAPEKPKAKKQEEVELPVPSAPKIIEKVIDEKIAPPPTLSQIKSDDSIVDVAPKQTILEKIVEDTFPPHVITVSSTEKIGMAVFRRNDWLWIVMDRSDLRVPPILAGPRKDVFPDFEEVAVKGGRAYRMALPEEAKDLTLYGDGGGLLWRIIVSPRENDGRHVTPKRVFSDGNKEKGGMLVWPMSASKVLEINDPEIGDILYAATVSLATANTGKASNFSEFSTLQSLVGLTIQTKVDDIIVAITGSGIEVTRPDGLALSRTADVMQRMLRKEAAEEAEILKELAVETANLDDDDKTDKPIFHFNRWMMGGLQALAENQKILLANLASKTESARLEDILTLAKMHLANGRGYEASGYIQFAYNILPELEDSPEFLALRGVAYALSGKYELAFRDLHAPAMQKYKELDYWRSYTLAWLEDWQQAIDMLPDEFGDIIDYPLPILENMGIKLAEVSLRNGDVEKAEIMLATLNSSRSKLSLAAKSGIEYLRGEAFRQRGDIDKAIRQWDRLSRVTDDFYRARSGLAVTMLELSSGKIEVNEAIDRLEGLRYAWRGDELEAKINFLLGKLYLDEDRYIKGLSIMRDAASMSEDSDISRQVTEFMNESFQALIISDENITPLDAITVYEEFKELTPQGQQGDLVVQRLAERLVEADLLERATEILEHQVEHRLQGAERARISVRLAATFLLNNDSRQAAKYLGIARKYYKDAPQNDETKIRLRDISLLHARALSQLGRTTDALEYLDNFELSPEVNRLRADIAWNAGLWKDAAIALNDLILDYNINPDRPLNEHETQIILNRAVALNLSGDRVELDNLRIRYGQVMQKTPRSGLFDVVTRPRQSTILTNRETIQSLVEEVDMFKDFLEAYRIDKRDLN